MESDNTQDKKAEIDALQEQKAESNEEIQDQFSERYIFSHNYLIKEMFLFREQYQTEKQRLRQIFFSQFIVAILSILTIFYGINGIVHFGFLFIGISLFGLSLYESLELKIKLVQIIFLVLASLTFIASYLLVSAKEQKIGYALSSGSFLAYFIAFSIFKITRKLTIKSNKKFQEDQENQYYIAFVQQNFKVLNCIAIGLMILSLIFGYALSNHSLGGFGFMLLILFIYEIVAFMFDYILVLLEKVQFKCIQTEDNKIILLITTLFVLYSLISLIFLEISEIFSDIYSKAIAGTIFGMGIGFVTYFKWKIDIEKLKNK